MKLTKSNLKRMRRRKRIADMIWHCRSRGVKIIDVLYDLGDRHDPRAKISGYYYDGCSNRLYIGREYHGALQTITAIWTENGADIRHEFHGI